MVQFQTSGVIFDGKVNILGALALYRLKVNVFKSFQRNRKKLTKIVTEIRKFLRKTSFR